MKTAANDIGNPPLQKSWGILLFVDEKLVKWGFRLMYTSVLL
jgi:hypothetical protein